MNKFPGDWQVTSIPDTATSPSTMECLIDTANSNTYSEYDKFHATLTDPDSYWMPQADCTLYVGTSLAAQTLIPRSARMPNIGYLQYLRTGIIPDDETVPYNTQKGTPFRLLSFAPSTETANQTTTTSTQAYPDWAMLDLLYVPSQLAPYGGPYGYYDPSPSTTWHGFGTPSTLAHYSTCNGSTPGRINPNGSCLYTTNTDIPTGITRTVPLQGVLQGLMVNQTLVQNTLAVSQASGHANPGLTGGSAVNASTIAQAIATYIGSNGPLRLPSEICNVPEIAALRPTVNPTRNDLVRQVLGALTTQSNVFSVWTVGQTIKKSPLNSGYGKFEPGDVVLAETRFHFVVERYLDPGADGFYGNKLNTGTDGIAGTYDDPLDATQHPMCPGYLYRVISSEEIH